MIYDLGGVLGLTVGGSIIQVGLAGIIGLDVKGFITGRSIPDEGMTRCSTLTCSSCFRLIEVR